MAVALGVITLSAAIGAQSRDVVAKAVVLEAASIKESHEDRGGALVMRPGGLFVATNIRVRDFVNMAFRTDPVLVSQQIIDLPPWASMVRYNITAKYVPTHDPVVGDTDSGPIIRALLDTRFAFKAHMEKREMPVYVVAIAPGGPKLRPAPTECAAPDNNACGTLWAQGRVTSRNMTLDAIVSYMPDATERPVLDRTGLAGHYDIDFQWNRILSQTLRTHVHRSSAPSRTLV